MLQGRSLYHRVGGPGDRCFLRRGFVLRVFPMRNPGIWGNLLGEIGIVGICLMCWGFLKAKIHGSSSWVS